MCKQVRQGLHGRSIPVQNPEEEEDPGRSIPIIYGYGVRIPDRGQGGGKWQRGATLMEVVLAVAIFGLLMTTILAFYTGGIQSWSRGSKNLDLQQNARIAMDIIVRELRYARSLADFQSEGVLPLYRHGVEGQRGADNLQYVDVDGHWSELCFNRTKRIITLREKQGSPNEIAYDVAGLDFYRYVPPGNPPAKPRDRCPMLLVYMKAQERAPGQRAEAASYILQSVVRLQNLNLALSVE